MIELVVKLPEQAYEVIKRNDVGIHAHNLALLTKWIADGKVIPKGHGRLIDADSMKTMKNIQSANFNAIELIRFWIDNQPTIIEADKKGAEE